MNTHTTVPITEARKKIFSIAKEVSSGTTYYTLTEHGRPKVVVASASIFEDLLEQKKRGLYTQTVTSSSKVADRSQFVYQSQPFFAGFMQALLVNDRSKNTLSYEQMRAVQNERELAKAQLYVELMEKYSYPIEMIQLGQYVRIGDTDSRQYIEVDIMVDDVTHDRVLIFFVSSQRVREKEHAKILEQMFSVANSFSFSAQKSVHLVHYTRYYNKKKLTDQKTIIDYTAYSSMRAWVGAKKPELKDMLIYGS